MLFWSFSQTLRFLIKVLLYCFSVLDTNCMLTQNTIIHSQRAGQRQVQLSAGTNHVTGLLKRSRPNQSRSNLKEAHANRGRCWGTQGPQSPGTRIICRDTLCAFLSVHTFWCTCQHAWEQNCPIIRQRVSVTLRSTTRTQQPYVWGVPHGDLHAKQQFMQLRDTVICEGVSPRSKIQHAVQQNLHKLNSYETIQVGLIHFHFFIDCSRPSCCQQGSSSVFVLYKLPDNTSSAASEGPACTMDAKGATISIFKLVSSAFISLHRQTHNGSLHNSPFRQSYAKIYFCYIIQRNFRGKSKSGMSDPNFWCLTVINDPKER